MTAMASWLARSLGEIAASVPGATRVFHQYHLDFCCGGGVSLAEALADAGQEPALVVAALEALSTQPAEGVDWRLEPLPNLIRHLLTDYHDKHRSDLPELIRLASRVEQVHDDHPDCPHGLAQHLGVMRDELEMHMQKEEMVLFPMIGRGDGAMAQAPVSVMRHEHEHHGEALRVLEHLTDRFNAPVDACPTWRALYTGARALREELMQHIHLENNVLFPRALAKPAGGGCGGGGGCGCQH